MKISVRLFLAFLLMTALTVGVLWVVQAGLMRDSYADTRVRSVAQALEQAIRQQHIDYQALGEELNAGVFRTDGEGRQIWPSQGGGIPRMRQFLVRAQAMIAEDQARRPAYIQTGSASGRFALVGRRMADNSYLFAAFSLADMDVAATVLRNELWILTAILLVLSFVLAVVLSRRLSRPIQQVTGAARQMAGGDWNIALPSGGRGEVGELQDALNKLGIELRKTEHLQRELIANVSHELRSPLTIIRGYAELVRDVSWPDEERRTRQLNLIVSESDRLTRVVRDILDYSRLQAGVQEVRMEAFALAPLLEQLLERFAAETVTAGVTLRAYGDVQAVVYFNRDRLDQVLHNLIQNALTHARKGTEVSIRVEPLAERQVRVSVTNQGEAIAAEDLPRIWERYQQTAASDAGRRGGTGLGLAIVRSLLEQYQSAFGVSSGPEGTVFWFQLSRGKLADETNQATGHDIMPTGI